ncbi:MAG: hypothetical protein ACTHJR_11660 [Sphingomonas sp.]
MDEAFVSGKYEALLKKLRPEQHIICAHDTEKEWLETELARRGRTDVKLFVVSPVPGYDKDPIFKDNKTFTSFSPVWYSLWWSWMKMFIKENIK